MEFKAAQTKKYEVVVAYPEYNRVVNGKVIPPENKAYDLWKKYAKEFYEKTGVYVSAIANKGLALYNDEWGCPIPGEPVITFNCTANTTTFINDIDWYQRGVLYIAGRMKLDLKQSTVTITELSKDGVNIIYLDDESNETINEMISIVSNWRRG